MVRYFMEKSIFQILFETQKYEDISEKTCVNAFFSVFCPVGCEQEPNAEPSLQLLYFVIWYLAEPEEVAFPSMSKFLRVNSSPASEQTLYREQPVQIPYLQPCPQLSGSQTWGY